MGYLTPPRSLLPSIFGNQKNCRRLRNSTLKDLCRIRPSTKPFIAKAILFRTVLSMVRAAKLPAYQANISAYAVAATLMVCRRQNGF
jgi:hypothetical protein